MDQAKMWTVYVPIMKTEKKTLQYQTYKSFFQPSIKVWAGESSPD